MTPVRTRLNAEQADLPSRVPSLVDASRCGSRAD
jgi:hypothetical protein